MFYLIPTKRGIGIELWGTYDDLYTLYDTIGKFWNKEGYTEKPGFDSRDQVISGFVHEIRKAYEGSRNKRKHSHFTLDSIPYFGCRISWVHAMFAINAIRCNMSFLESNKFDLGTMLQFEYWMEMALVSFDEVTGSELKHYIDDGIQRGNPYLYQYMRSINADYFELGGGKSAFKKLSNLLKKGVYPTDEYNKYKAFLVSESKRLNCSISDLELSDDHIKYDKIKW